MRIAIMGSGGIGGYFGAKLAQGGAEVSFIARGAHLAAMRADGLRVESAGGVIELPAVRATDDPVTIGPVDLVLLGVKLWDTEAALRAIEPLTHSGAAVVSFQNGVQKDDQLRAALGADVVIGGVSYVAAAIARPGVISQTGAMQRLVFGELDGSRSGRVDALLEACRAGGIDAEVSDDIKLATWQKFVFLVGISGLTASTRLSIGPVRENPDSRALLLDTMREVVAVGRALGVELAEDFAENRLAFCDGLPAAMKASMLNDLERGNRLELPWLSGGAVELGHGVGVPTPCNRALAGILAPHAAGRSATP